MSGRPELPYGLHEVLEHVRQEVSTLAGSYARIGLRVTAIDTDTDNGRPFPDLLIYLQHDDVEGERVGRYYLEHNGHLEGPGDAAGNVAIGILETTAQEIARLPRSAEDTDGI